jgi:hypothetical protein
MLMVLEMNRAVVGSLCKGSIPVCPSWWGFVRVVVIEDVAAQEVGYLLDEALQEESEFGVPVSDGSGHGGDACLDVGQLGVEVFSGKGWRSYRGTEEAETSCEFGWEWRAEDINIVRFGRVSGDCFRDQGGKRRIGMV